MNAKTNFYLSRRLIPCALWLVLGLLAPRVAHATVDLLKANHVTRQLHVFDEGNYPGLFWCTVAGEDPVWREKERDYLSRGYTYTDFPFMLEYGLLCAAAISILLLVLRRSRKVR